MLAALRKTTDEQQNISNERVVRRSRNAERKSDDCLTWLGVLRLHSAAKQRSTIEPANNCISLFENTKVTATRLCPTRALVRNAGDKLKSRKEHHATIQ